MVNKKIVLIIVVIIALLLIFYWQVLMPKDLNQTECKDALARWCTNCFSENNGLTDIWENPGTKVGSQLSKCTSQFLSINLSPEQDCTDAIGYCIAYIQE